MSIDKKKIVMVDDDPVIITIYTRLIEKYLSDVDIISTTDSTTAINLIQKENPDLLLTDFNMPDVLGIDVIRNVRDCEELDDINIIMCTSDDMSVYKAELHNLNVIGIFPKGTSIFGFMDLVNEGLGYEKVEDWKVG